MSRLEQALDLVRAERARQDERYGKVNHLQTIGFGSNVPAYPWLSPFSDANSASIEAAFRGDYRRYEDLHGHPSKMHLIREEVAELFDTRTSSDAIGEAIQVAALCVSVCEQLLAQQDEGHTAK